MKSGMRKIKRLAAALLAIAVIFTAVTVAAQTGTITRDDIAATLSAVVDEYFDVSCQDFEDALADEGITIEEVIDLVYALNEALVAFNALHSGEGYVDAAATLWNAAFLVVAFAMTDQIDIANGYLLQLRSTVAWIESLDESLGFETVAQFLMLPIFSYVDDLLPLHLSYEWIIYNNPYSADVFAFYGAEILDILDFDIFEAHEYYLATGEMPHGLAVLNSLMGMDISAKLLANGGIDDENAETDLLLGQIYRIFDGFVWDDLLDEVLVDIRLGMGNLEQRLAFATDYVLGFDILLDFNVFARLNLFFRNNSDEYAFFYILAFGVQRQPFVFLVPPGGERTIQLMPMDIIAVIVEVTVMSMQGEPVDGEFALRLTELPLP